jgi:hypothetical protein
MKMHLLVYGRDVDEEVIAALKKAGILAYTKMEEVCGEGLETEPRLGTRIWPGRNNVLFIAMTDEHLAGFKDLVLQLKSKHPRAGIRGFTLPLEESF